jgi:hypothetical protein
LIAAEPFSARPCKSFLRVSGALQMARSSASSFKGLPERPEFVAYAGRVAERPAAKRATQKDQKLAAAG